MSHGKEITTVSGSPAYIHPRGARDPQNCQACTKAALQDQDACQPWIARPADKEPDLMLGKCIGYINIYIYFIYILYNIYTLYIYIYYIIYILYILYYIIYILYIYILYNIYIYTLYNI